MIRPGLALWILPLVLALLGMPGAAHAQGLQVTPILVQLQPGQMTSTLMVTNKSDAPASLQIRPYQWDQTDTNDTLKPTAELAVSPPITEVPPGQTQIFRLVLRRGATTKEASYRLLLDQLPPPGAPGTVRVILRFSIPVFATAAARADTDLAWRIVMNGGNASLIGTNKGNTHARILNPVLTAPGGGTLTLVQGQSPYILPGSERSWHIQTAAALHPGSTAHLVASSDGGPVDAMVRVSMP